MAGPCLCGDPECAFCGIPTPKHIESFLDGVYETLNKWNPDKPDDYEGILEWIPETFELSEPECDYMLQMLPLILATLPGSLKNTLDPVIQKALETYVGIFSQIVSPIHNSARVNENKAQSYHETLIEISARLGGYGSPVLMNTPIQEIVSRALK